MSAIIFSLNPILTHSTPLINNENVKTYGPIRKDSVLHLQGRYPLLTGDGLYISRSIDSETASGILILVNKSNSLSEDYVPSNLRDLNLPSAIGATQLKDVAATSLEEMFEDAKQDGHELFVRTGYRSYQTQYDIFYNNVRKYGREYTETFSAPPGSSEHQTGLVVDITSPSVDYALVEKFGTSPEGKWVENNSWNYGFIIRYPKDKTYITKYTYEPWHLRYVGKNAAKDIYHRNITLEEYLEK